MSSLTVRSAVLCATVSCLWLSTSASRGEPVTEAVRDGAVVKKVVTIGTGGRNLLTAEAWSGWREGFRRDDDVFLCDNGSDDRVERGVSQMVTLNQQTPRPIVARLWSKAEGVGGSRNSDYALYLDLTYQDGTPLWGQIDTLNVGTHDWEKAEVLVFPAKPVKTVHFHMLLRRHTGKAWFRDPQLHVMDARLFDGVAIQPTETVGEGFQVRDVAANSDFIRIAQQALDLELDCDQHTGKDATFFDVTIADTSGTDRAITLLYAIPVGPDGCRWLRDPRGEFAVEPSREYVHSGSFSAGANGRLSRYPFGAVAVGDSGLGLGIDMDWPAFFRVGYNADTGELFLAYDIGLTPEQPQAHVRFCRFTFDATWQFRSALAQYYYLFRGHFRCRIPQQGLWMPFAKISQVKDWEDFGFRFKEGTNETAWDDEHDIITFRYTEPMTWWMRMAEGTPRTMEAALAEAKRLADEKQDRQAQAFFSSGFHDETGQFAARLLDTPWCDGAVWSMNSMPAIAGEVTDFKNKWNAELIEQLYGPQRAADLDGEYVDSSEGYVTDELDFRRGHFAYATTPLTFARTSHRPAIFRGLIAFEYVRAIARDVHTRGKLMMANSTPYRLCWLAPLLDVLGSETDWNPGGSWRPMSDSDLLYRRVLCQGKPYCFLMNTDFDRFSHDRVEKYMKRCLAYGMFPGFFSHNASEGHYFTRPTLYERDRDLFRKYVPLCKQVAQAGWQPIPHAHSSVPDVYVERFGERYLTVLNDSDQRCEVTVTSETALSGPHRELVRDRDIVWRDGKATLTLEAEDVAVLVLD